MDTMYDKLLTEAKKSCMEKRYGAILVYKNKIISCGHNGSRRKISSLSNQCILQG